jgi:hypothetical protein
MKLNFNYEIHKNTSKENLKFKGKPLTCKACGFQFRLITPEDKYNWQKTNLICPSCGVINCIKPKTERKLNILQLMYLEDRQDQYVHSEFYSLYKSYTRSIILQLFTNVITSPDEIEYHSHNSVSKVFLQYLSRPDFKINSSFASYVLFKVKESLWHRDEHDTAQHSIHETNDDGKEKFVIESECAISDHYKGIIESKDLIDSLYKFLKSEVYSHKEIEFKLLLALNSFLKSGERGSNKIFNQFGIEGKTRFNRVLTRLRSKILESST